MTDKTTNDSADSGNMKKDPDDWVTGDEPMTGAQRSYLKTLSETAHVPFDESLSKAEASRRIDALQAQTGRKQVPQGHDEGGGGPGPTPAAPASQGEPASQPYTIRDLSGTVDAPI